MTVPARAPHPRHGRLAALLGGLAFVMLGAAFAAVPFYRWFCATTGYGGTPMIVEKVATAPGRAIDVRFDTNVAGGLPWHFAPEVSHREVATGTAVTVAFHVTNTSDATTRGVAVFNVTPPLVGAHFGKIACFCFEEQTLAPGETLEAPVTFWIDPAIDADKNVAGLAGVTLSYTFFPVPAAKAAPAQAAGLPAIRPDPRPRS